MTRVPSAKRGPVLCILVAIVGLAMVLIDVGGVVRTGIAVIAVCGAPGFALVAAVGPPPRAAERSVLSIGASIAIGVLVGLVLAAVPGALNADGFAIALAAVTIVAALVALARPSPSAADSPAAIRLRPRDNVLLVVAAALAVSAFLVARDGATTQAARVQFTQAWVLPTADAGQIEVGVRSFEAEPVEYRVQILGAGNRRLRRYVVALEPGESSVRRLGLSSTQRRGRVLLRVYRADMPGVLYRTVRLAEGS